MVIDSFILEGFEDVFQIKKKVLLAVILNAFCVLNTINLIDCSFFYPLSKIYMF